MGHTADQNMFHSNAYIEVYCLVRDLGIGLGFFIHSVCILSYGVACGAEIMPRNKIDKPQVVYRFSGNIMMSTITLRT